MQDKYGLEFTTEQDCKTDVDLIIDLFFQKRNGIENLLPTVADKNLTCAILQLYTAILVSFSFSTTIIAENIPVYLARLNYDSLNTREKLYYKGVQNLLEPNLEQAFTCFELVINQYPQDRVAVLVLETLGWAGGIFPRLDNVYKAVQECHLADDADFLGMVGFLYCHQDKKSKAQAVVLKALESNPKNAWLQHVFNES